MPNAFSTSGSRKLTFKIATRGSPLALWQARWVQENILEQHPEISVELLILKTTGDRIQDRPLSEVGGKGLFIKELETALLDGRADMAVHSMKDVTGFSQKVWKYQSLLNVKIQVTRGSVQIWRN